jgi:O-acetylserine/cysteine efflux transporter
MEISTGLLFGLASAVAMAIGSLMIKRFANATPLQLQAWIAFVSAPPLILFTLLAETGQWESSVAAGWVFAGALAFSVIFVTMFAHTAYFSLLRSHPASIVAPLSLMMPVMSVTMGVFLLGEPFGVQMAIGSVMTLLGLIPILIRFPNRGARAISGEA